MNSSTSGGAGTMAEKVSAGLGADGYGDFHATGGARAVG